MDAIELTRSLANPPKERQILASGSVVATFCSTGFTGYDYRFSTAFGTGIPLDSGRAYGVAQQAMAAGRNILVVPATEGSYGQRLARGVIKGVGSYREVEPQFSRLSGVYEYLTGAWNYQAQAKFSGVAVSLSLTAAGCQYVVEQLAAGVAAVAVDLVLE